MVRTRIAPSPTGYPHIGTIYQALFNYAYAKKHKGSFIVRIEDTDRARFVEDAEKVIFTALDWFGLTEDESSRKNDKFGPYRQSERLALYHHYAQQLIDAGHARFEYYPKTSAGQKKDYTEKEAPIVRLQTSDQPPKTIEEMLTRQDWVVRMNVAKTGSITVKDEIRGNITFDYSQVTEQVLIKSDGYPTYHLAVVVDDHLMEISDIVRAEEWISSLPKHVLLYQYFDWKMPPVYHTATLRNPDKSKLSKRHGHTNVEWYKEEGYLPQAILNYLALLGWSHPEEKEIFSLGEFMTLFDLKDIKPVAPIFDLQKLTWMNGMYLRSMDKQLLFEKIIAYDEFFKKIDTTLLQELVSLAQTRIETLKEFSLLTKGLLTNQEYTLTELEKEIAKNLQSKLEILKEWNSDTIFVVMKEVMQEKKIRMPVLYKILTGNVTGLPLPQTLAILGKDQTIQRLHL